MTTLYWVLEYVKVLFAYMFVMFIWPQVVFRKYLKPKSLQFRFAFCSTVMVVIVNSVVLMLGLVHLLNPWVFRALFYGSFIWSLFCDVKITKRQRKQVKWLLTRTYGVRTFLQDVSHWLEKKVKNRFRDFKWMMHSKWWECFLLAIVVIYGMIYFTYGAFQDYSYGFGDLYPHNQWIYGLSNGEIFVEGVYPEGMHCFVYAMHTLFGIRIYSCLLFTAGIHILVFLVSAYILLREVFRWKYSPMLAMTFFLTVDVLCINEIYSMSRLQWTLPQEFGLYTQFLCAAYLAKYIKGASVAWPNVQVPEEIKWWNRWKKWRIWKWLQRGWWDENIFIFMMSLAASLVIHFYATIMAFFLCVAFIPLVLHKVFSKKRFWSLVTAVMCGVMIAVIPMAGALASGIPFQGSIGWAMSVINGVDTEAIEDAQAQAEDAEEERKKEELQNALSGGAVSQPVVSGSALSSQSQNSVGNVSGSSTTKGSSVLTGDAVTSQGAVTGVAVSPEKGPSLVEKLKYAITHLDEILLDTIDIVYREAYVTLYRVERANHILIFTAAAVAIWLVCRIFAMFLRYICRIKKVDITYFDGYFSIVLSSVLFMMLYCASALGLPALIAGSRLCSVTQLFITAVCIVPVDLLCTGLACFMKEAIMKIVAALGIAGIYAGMVVTGNFHGFLYYELTRHNGAVMTTYTITEQLPKHSFTIVSCVDEIYQVIEYGFHEELVNFINESTEEDYTLPSEYVFLYLEKKPIEYAQSHFFTGPKWLAWEKYADYYNSYVSQCPDITTSEISMEIAEEPYAKMALSARTYSNLEKRTVLESRLYAWVQEFERLYPNELHTYYEDENFVCYYFKQNPLSLFQLAIQDSGYEYLDSIDIVSSGAVTTGGAVNGK